MSGAVTFLRTWRQYQRGETATFEPKQAAKLITEGTARRADKAAGPVVEESPDRTATPVDWDAERKALMDQAEEFRAEFAKREEDLTERAADLDKREAALAERAADLDQREAALPDASTTADGEDTGDAGETPEAGKSTGSGTKGAPPKQGAKK